MIQDHLRGLLEDALDMLKDDGSLPSNASPSITIERPARPEHGDFYTNLALELAGSMKMPPRAAADVIQSRLPSSDHVAKVEVAGPGFINFYLSRSWLYDTIVEIATRKKDYGRSKLGEGVRIQVEFGSANPTGPLHIGNARNIAYGDALASLLETTGFSVERENYLNDTGGQVERFARSLEARYLQALGRKAELPQDGYAGDYLVEMGKELASAEGMGLIDKPDEIRAWGLAKMIELQRLSLERFGVRHDNWVSQSSLEESGKVSAAIDRLREAGHIYEADGAVWFRASSFGPKEDRVMIRSDDKGGRPTYRAADTAYLLDKLDRGFDRLIYFWGADHHATATDLMAMARALGVEDHVEIILYQFVNPTGSTMSKRSGDYVTLDELIDEVGVDAARFTLLSHSPDSIINFDFDLVKAQSQENPVYYVQYAHARISSILRYGQEQGIELLPIDQVELAELATESERELMRTLAEFPETVEVSAKLRAPYRLTYYARTVAEDFHAFYRDCRVISEDTQLTQARLWLGEATRQVLANTLRILGVSAPERM